MKAGLFVTLSESYQTFVNGLARNYDGSAKREFTSSVGGIETDVCIWSSSFQLDQFCKVKGPRLKWTVFGESYRTYEKGGLILHAPSITIV